MPSQRYLELSTEVAEGKVWQNLTLERYRAAMPIAIQPVVIQQENDLGDGLMREWDAPDLGIEKHYGYAFQWFALAAAILIFYLAIHVRKRAPQPDSLWLIGALCVAPVIASYVAFYFAPPASYMPTTASCSKRGRCPTCALQLTDGTPFQLSRLKGKWVLLMVDSGDCDEFCRRKLFTLRQLRLSQGKDMERIERVWLISDDVDAVGRRGERLSGHLAGARRRQRIAQAVAGAGRTRRSHLYRRSARQSGAALSARRRSARDRQGRRAVAEALAMAVTRCWRWSPHATGATALLLIDSMVLNFALSRKPSR